MTDATAKQSLLDLLLRSEGQELMDIKFCPGTAEVVSEEWFALSILSALREASSPGAQISNVFLEKFSVAIASRPVVAA